MPNSPTPRVPRDAFETELFRRMLRARLENWRPYTVSSLGEINDDGTFSVLLTPKGTFQSWENLLKGPYAEVKIWLAEEPDCLTEHGRIEVWVSYNGETFEGLPPVIDWEQIKSTEVR